MNVDGGGGYYPAAEEGKEAYRKSIGSAVVNEEPGLKCLLLFMICCTLLIHFSRGELRGVGWAAPWRFTGKRGRTFEVVSNRSRKKGGTGRTYPVVGTQNQCPGKWKDETDNQSSGGPSETQLNNYRRTRTPQLRD